MSSNENIDSHLILLLLFLFAFGIRRSYLQSQRNQCFIATLTQQNHSKRNSCKKNNAFDLKLSQIYYAVTKLMHLGEKLVQR